MRVIAFIAFGVTIGERLRDILAELPAPDNVELFDDLRKFGEHLFALPPSTHSIVLLAPSRANLTELMRLGELLCERDVVLVLPDESDETVALAHRLRPHVVGQGASFAEELPGILARLARR